MSIFSDENVAAIAEGMYNVLGESVTEAMSYSKVEAKRLTYGLDLIQSMLFAGSISRDTAAAQVDALLESGRLFFKTNKEISGLKAKMAVHKGLQIAAEIVNGAIGFPLIPIST
jgi:hypothetical protein